MAAALGEEAPDNEDYYSLLNVRREVRRGHGSSRPVPSRLRAPPGGCRALPPPARGTRVGQGQGQGPGGAPVGPRPPPAAGPAREGAGGAGARPARVGSPRPALRGAASRTEPSPLPSREVKLGLGLGAAVRCRGSQASHGQVQRRGGIWK